MDAFLTKRATMKLPVLVFYLLMRTATGFCGDIAPDQPKALPPKVATIDGQALTGDQTPMVNGLVFLYKQTAGPPPHPYKYWRIPDSISPAGQDGNFSITVPEGTYYLMIAQKPPAEAIGPPEKSEYLYFHGDAAGIPKPLNATAGATLHLGKVVASLWSPDMIPHEKGITAIEGVVTDKDGKPAENAVVFAYLTMKAVGRPTFVSDRTDKNGNYQLRVYDGGTYYLKVRSVLGGGAPRGGEFLNTTEEFTPTMVTLAKNQILKGISLKGKKFSRKERAPGKEKRELGKPADSKSQ